MIASPLITPGVLIVLPEDPLPEPEPELVPLLPVPLDEEEDEELLLLPPPDRLFIMSLMLSWA